MEEWEQHWASVDGRCLQKVVVCQTWIRHWLVNKSQTRLKASIYTPAVEHSTLLLQARIRGCIARYHLWKQRQLYDEAVGVIWKVCY
jgi:hypothetical protein